MLNKLLATASAFSIVAGGASALVVDAVNPQVLAEELDYDGGEVSGELIVSFSPTGAAFPSGNLTLFVEVSGAAFAEGLDGDEVSGSDGAATPTTINSTVSTGGEEGAQAVSYVISEADICDDTGNCEIALPLLLDGDDVVVSVGLETDAGQPVDNSSEDDLEDVTVAQIVPAFTVEFDADETNPIATLDSEFEQFADGGLLGSIDVQATVAGETTVTTSIDGDPVSSDDIESIVYTITGSYVGIEDLEIGVDGSGSADAEINEGETAAVFEDEGGTQFGDAAQTYTLISDGEGSGAIQRSGYSASVEITVDDGSPLTEGDTFTGQLASVVREGTQIIFPWSQSASQGAASGVNSVYRFGNLSNEDIDAVFVEVRNSSNAAYEADGVALIPDADIPSGGEFTINSTQLEEVLGNYGRGDLEFTIEVLPENLTGRQFVVRNGNLEQTIGGTIAQDLDETGE